MTLTLARSVSFGASRIAVLGALLTVGACGGDPPTTTPEGTAGSAAQAGAGISQSGAGGTPGGGSGGTGSSTGGAGAGGAGGTSGGSAGMATAGSGGMTAGSGGTTAGKGGMTAGDGGMSGANSNTGGMAGGPPSTGGAGAGGTSSGGGAGAQALSFEADIWPVFEQIRDPVFVYYGGQRFESCVTSGVCHGGDDPGSGLSMTSSEVAYEMLLDIPSTSTLCNGTVRVVAGNPEESCLILFYEGRLRDELEWVDTAEIDLVREWIRQGALP